MNQFPDWLQIVIVFSIYTLISVIFAAVSRWKYLPVILRTPTLILSIVVIKTIDRIIPSSETVKNWSAGIWGASIVIFLILAFKNKWFWDEKDKNQAS